MNFKKWSKASISTITSISILFIVCSESGDIPSWPYVCCLLSFGLLITTHGWYIVWSLKLFITFCVGIWLVFLEDKLFLLGAVVSFVIILLQFGSILVLILLCWIVLNLPEHGYLIGWRSFTMYNLRLWLLLLLQLDLIHEFFMSSCTIWIRHLTFLMLINLLLLSVLVLLMFLLTYIKGPYSSCIGTLLSYPIQLVRVVTILG